MFGKLFSPSLQKVRQEYQELVCEQQKMTTKEWNHAHGLFLNRLLKAGDDDRGEQRSLLFSAVQHNDVELLKTMQTKFGDDELSQCNFRGKSILCDSILYKSGKCFNFLLSSVPRLREQDSLNCALGFCLTHPEYVEPLLAAGANPMAREALGISPIDIENVKSHGGFIKALLESPSLDATTKDSLAEYLNILPPAPAPAEEESLCFPENDPFPSLPHRGVQQPLTNGGAADL